MIHEIELFACPLCGGADVYVENTVTEAMVRCRQCGLSLKRDNGPLANEGVEDVQSAWNRPRGMFDLVAEARFLIDRLNEIEWSNLDDAYRDFAGHVSPSVARLSRLVE